MIKPDNNTFEQTLAEFGAKLDALLAELLADRVLYGEICRPARLLAAVRHGVLNGGKRLRPFLACESAVLFGTDSQSEALWRVCAALECVHCYSLIHDDLPAMDDDDLRRGLPTVHRAFDEATAILAGDALLTYAFDIIAAPQTDLSDSIRNELVLGLARASGPGGMVGGQMLDIRAVDDTMDEIAVIRLQAMKTGALIRFSCEAGAIIAGVSRQDRQRLAEFGAAIGLAFQLADDLLDLDADSATTGKATGKDAASGKATLIGIHGADWARKQMNGLLGQAEEILSPYGMKSDGLLAAARFVVNRNR